MPGTRKDFYTYAEACLAVHIKGFKKQADYNKHYKEDPRLPSRPAEVYAGDGWTDWFGFLGNVKPDLYLNYSEARAAAHALSIKSIPAYKKHCKKDPRLPSCPNKFYADDGWTDWYDFLGNAKPDLYSTYAEARAAVQALGIKTLPDYNKRYKDDLRLPSAPHKTYTAAGWTNWYGFLGNAKPDLYTTYAEALSAVRALRIMTLPDYNKRYKGDPRLPSCPHLVYAGVGWTDWYDFLGNVKPDLYPTFIEARRAAQKLCFKSQLDYRNSYKADPRLPSAPNKTYSVVGWTNWYDFLGNKNSDFYQTYAEAQAAVQVLGIRVQLDYVKGYKEDARLPSNPDKIYAGLGWTDWYNYLGNAKPDLYQTYAEAQAAVPALNIQSQTDYVKCYKQDRRLPSNPDKLYAGIGWTNWYDYLGNTKPDIYSFYAEARVAAQELNFKSQLDYNINYKKDERLPSSPDKTYADWVDWYDFLGNTKPDAIIIEYPRVWADLDRYLKTQTGITSKKAAIRSFLAGFYKPHGLPDDSKHLLLRTNPFSAETYQNFIEVQADSLKRSYHSAISAFFQWVLDEDCTDHDADERVVLPNYRNPFVTVLAGFADSLQSYRPTQSTKPPLGYEYILRARQFLVPEGEQVLQTRPSLIELPHLQRFFNSRIDWIYVDESVIDRSDPNCIWRFVESADRIISGKRQLIDSYQLWSPARFVALYTLLRFPLRGQQILWLDSGEADNELAVLDTESGGVRWEKNTSHLAGKGSKKRRAHAALQRGDKGAPKLYVTTNKTGRTEGGYDVEWIPDDLVYWFILLRDWQAKYNPLVEPTKWAEINLRAETNEKILKARGTQCFLFRTDVSGQPMHTTTSFTHTLPALLHQIQREGENLVIENPDRRSNSQRYLSPYTPHSLRVGLITAFIADGDAPIHLISKLVGHASLVMTIYYIKLNSVQMRRTMGETEKIAAQRALGRNAETVRLHGIQPLRSQLIATDGNSLLIESDVPNSACVVFDYGICPMSAASCHVGGEAVAERKVENLYAPVDAGYLGQKNCPRCRFFVTGVPFLGGLVALANEIALEVHTESGRFQGYAAEVARFEAEWFDACEANRPFLGELERKRAVANQQQSAAKLDGLLADYAAINHYVQSCLKLINGGELDPEGGEDIRLIVAGDLHEVGAYFNEGKTQYHLLAEICQNAAIYQSTNPSRAVPLIAQTIDRMAENNNLAPAMFRLTDEQKLVVINELNRFLLQRLGSWEKIDDLFAGDLMLLDIDTHESELMRISTEIQDILLRGGTRPITHKVPIHE